MSDAARPLLTVATDRCDLSPDERRRLARINIKRLNNFTEADRQAFRQQAVDKQKRYERRIQSPVSRKFAQWTAATI